METCRITPVVRALIVGIVAAAALLAAGCGGGDGGGSASGADPEQYAADICGAISDWRKELQTSQTTMSSKLGASPTPEEVKTQLVAFMEGATKSTEDMVDKVKEAGPPDIEKGEALQRDLEQGLTAAQTAFASARDEVKKLPTDNPSAFQSQAQKLGTTLTEEGTKIGETFNGLSTKYDSDELNEAFDKEPSCQGLS